MPLFYKGQEVNQISSVNGSASSKICLPAELVKEAQEWTKQPVKRVDTNVLYVAQREYAVIDPTCQGRIEYIAADSATTCHILILIHPESKAIGVSHFDGCDTEVGVKNLLSEMETRVRKLLPSSGEASAPRYHLYLFGGFMDAKGTSNELSLQIFDALKKCSQLVDVMVMCIGELNSRYMDGICYPIYYGAGVNCATLEVHNMECMDRGPLQDVRGCRNFVGPQKMVNCYDHQTQQIMVEPFNFRPFNQIELWLQQTDEFLLKYLSTSGAQEPAHFIASVRESLLCIQNHPQPMISLFKNNKTFRFMLAEGRWVQVNESLQH